MTVAGVEREATRLARAPVDSGAASPGAELVFAIVRDLFVNEPAFPWSESTQGLPYAITIVMFFAGNTDLKTSVLDLSTMFTEPASYLPYVTGVAVYARDKWDTPIERVRALSLDDMAQLRVEGEV